MIDFQFDDPSLESQWRAIILFGRNSATYKFAFAKALLQAIDKERTNVKLDELARPYSFAIVEHLKSNDKQGNSNSSKFLEKCRNFRDGLIDEDELIDQTLRDGFKYVVDAFQNVHGDLIAKKFYEVNPSNRREIIITDNLLSLGELYQFKNLGQEVEARWRLVETAWDLNISKKLIDVVHDSDASILYVDNKTLTRRINITSVRDALNGYQKGKCFYSFKDISIVPNDSNICHVDHFFPHVNIVDHHNSGSNLNGVWNLVLSEKSVNSSKLARLPEERFLNRLYRRNEFYIESKHPLAETIIRQTGATKESRISFLKNQYKIALNNSSGFRWKPDLELAPLF